MKIGNRKQRPLVVPKDLVQRVNEGRLSPEEAQVLTRARITQKKRDEIAGWEELARELSIKDWQRRQAEEKTMSPTWAKFVLAHSPALGDSVIHGNLPLREAVRLIKERSGCELDCAHRPLTADQKAAFLAYAAREGFDEEKATVILEYAPDMVEFQQPCAA